MTPSAVSTHDAISVLLSSTLPRSEALSHCMRASASRMSSPVMDAWDPSAPLSSISCFSVAVSLVVYSLSLAAMCCCAAAGTDAIRCKAACSRLPPYSRSSAAVVLPPSAEVATTLESLLSSSLSSLCSLGSYSSPSLRQAIISSGSSVWASTWSVMNAASFSSSSNPSNASYRISQTAALAAESAAGFTGTSAEDAPADCPSAVAMQPIVPAAVLEPPVVPSVAAGIAVSFSSVAPHHLASAPSSRLSCHLTSMRCSAVNLTGSAWPRCCTKGATRLAARVAPPASSAPPPAAVGP
mmetsp:Transcript_17123/g.51253  ORF Transcript_17123/g.51253 Transcript_17123/m.51253 type:complete len:297 (+) Transcript_17123:1800-2690(+)